MCVTGCGLMESSDHLFLHCNIFGSVWHFIYRWLGISAVTPAQVPDHFNHFRVSGGIAKRRHSLRSFGLLQFGKFGKKETIGFLAIKKAR